MATKQNAKQKAAAIKKQEAAKAKKAEVAAAKKQEMVDKKAAELVTLEGPIKFTSKESQNIIMIGKNQERILKAVGTVLDIAVDTGSRLLALKDAVKKHGGKWKDWCKTEGNLPFSYEQANRYSKLAANPEQLLLVKQDGVTSIEEAVMAIEHLKKPEKAEAAEAKKVAAAAAPAKVVPFTINAAFDMLNTMALEDLREIQTYLVDRIEELTQAAVDADDDDDDTAAEDAADAADHVDPLS